MLKQVNAICLLFLVANASAEPVDPALLAFLGEWDTTRQESLTDQEWQWLMDNLGENEYAGSEEEPGGTDHED